MKDLETIFKGHYNIPEIDRVDETKTRTTHALIWNNLSRFSPNEGFKTRFIINPYSIKTDQNASKEYGVLMPDGESNIHPTDIRVRSVIFKKLSFADHISYCSSFTIHIKKSANLDTEEYQYFVKLSVDNNELDCVEIYNDYICLDGSLYGTFKIKTDSTGSNLSAENVFNYINMLSTLNDRKKPIILGVELLRKRK